MASLWFSRGGAYVLANVRGGTERPNWYVRGPDRWRVYEDTVAVAQDLFRRRITAPDRLGFFGHSAGGALAGVMLTLFPECFGAILPSAGYFDFLAPLSDIPGLNAYEWGSVDIPHERMVLEQTSPMLHVSPRMKRIRPLILTSTTDDVVYPRNSRRFAAQR